VVDHVLQQTTLAVVVPVVATAHIHPLLEGLTHILIAHLALLWGPGWTQEGFETIPHYFPHPRLLLQRILLDLEATGNVVDVKTTDGFGVVLSALIAGGVGGLEQVFLGTATGQEVHHLLFLFVSWSSETAGSFPQHFYLLILTFIGTN
jgi:hypothetical protein